MKSTEFGIITLVVLLSFGFVFPSAAVAQDSLIILVIPSGREITLNIVASTQAVQNLYRYQYTITSSAQSNQSTNWFEVQGSSLVDSISSPLGWWGNSYGIRAIVSWGSDSLHRIAPGTSLGGFGLVASGLPAIQTYYAQGWFPVPMVDVEPDSIVNGDMIGNMINGRTVGPVTPPAPFNGLNFLDTIKSYINQSRPLGWITNQTTADKYTRLIDSARSNLQANNRGVTKAKLDSVLVNANADSSSTLTSEAYALLRFNTEYVLNKLREEDELLDKKNK